MRKNNLAYREEFLAGRVGIRAKILIYLAILAGFIISTVWMLQGVLFRNLYRGATVIQIEDAVRTQFLLTVGAIVLATVLVGFTIWPQEYSVMFPKDIKAAAAPYVKQKDVRKMNRLVR